jgi:AraC family transcriptional regulator
MSPSSGRYFSDDAYWTSADCGWNSLHLRRYRHGARADEFSIHPLIDNLLVLVTKGATLLERHAAGRWQTAAHVPGHISTLASGDTCRLRWDGDTPHETLQLHLPVETLEAAIEDLREERPSSARAEIVSAPDPLVSQIMLSLSEAASAGVPDLYAESAAHLLARHLLIRSPSDLETRTSDAARLYRIEEYMRAHLAENITLANMAEVAGCSPFQLLRSCKSAWAETPFQRLTALRMKLACRLLRSCEHSVTTIAFDCGYSNPSHFAIAFRRVVGVSPSEYRHG